MRTAHARNRNNSRLCLARVGAFRAGPNAARNASAPSRVESCHDANRDVSDRGVVGRIHLHFQSATRLHGERHSKFRPSVRGTTCHRGPRQSCPEPRRSTHDLAVDRRIRFETRRPQFVGGRAVILRRHDDQRSAAVPLLANRPVMDRHLEPVASLPQRVTFRVEKKPRTTLWMSYVSAEALHDVFSATVSTDLSQLQNRGQTRHDGPRLSTLSDRQQRHAAGLFPHETSEFTMPLGHPRA